MKKATCTATAFENILYTMHNKCITTKEELMADQVLYAEFWFMLKNFCHSTLLTKTSGKKADGEYLPGNFRKIDVLASRGVTTREELETDCAIKILDKLNYVLRQPIEKQKNYCFTICNNLVNDKFRELPPDSIELISLQSAVKSQKSSIESTCTYEQVVGSEVYNPQRMFIERDNICELTVILNKKKAKELAEKRKSFLSEIEALSAPSQVLVRTACVHNNIKPRELAQLILEKGLETTYAEVLALAARKYKISADELRRIITNKPIKTKHFKTETNDPSIVSAKIYNIGNRAKNTLSTRK